MGKASRQRRLNKEKERQRLRAARGASSQRPGLGYQQARRQVPAQKDIVLSLVAEAVQALSAGDHDAYGGSSPKAARDERTPGWTQAVGDNLTEFLRVSVRGAWRHG